MKIAVAEINLAALEHNLQVVKQHAPNSHILAMLKANAYGHGTTQIAKALDKADAFGVARLSEAVALRAAGITKPIVLLEGFFEAEELHIIANLGLDTVLHSEHQVTQFIETQLPRSIRVWLKVDTGMNRLGVKLEQAMPVLSQLKGHRNVFGEPILMSHFGCADNTQHSLNQQQLTQFADLFEQQSGEGSLANSAAILSLPASHYQWVRPGLMLYGVSPMDTTSAEEHELLPVMTLKSSVIAIRSIKKGESVGYGATWFAPRDTRLAVIAIGYGDGYPRNAANGTPVLINQKQYPLAGRVSMDMITVDIGPTPIEHDAVTNAPIINDTVTSDEETNDASAKGAVAKDDITRNALIDDALIKDAFIKDVVVGDEVTLWGEGLPIEHIAEQASTVPYELLCGVTGRVEKQFSNVRSTPARP